MTSTRLKMRICCRCYLAPARLAIAGSDAASKRLSALTAPRTAMLRIAPLGSSVKPAPPAIGTRRRR